MVAITLGTNRLGPTTLVASETRETLCVVRELDEVEIPAKRDGVIEKLVVRRGMRVTARQEIAFLENKDTRLRLKVAKAELTHAIAKSRDTASSEAAEVAVRRARMEKRLLEELGTDAVYLEKFRMQNNLERSLAELKSSNNVLQQSILQVDVKRGEADVLQNALAETVVSSPVNGIVLELKKHQGEWAKQGEPILTVTRMDRLLAEGFLDSETVSVNTIIGASATLTFKIGGGETFVLEGLVVKLAAPKLELDGKFPIWVEFENQMIRNENGAEGWLIRPGMRASMSITVDRPKIVAASTLKTAPIASSPSDGSAK